MSIKRTSMGLQGLIRDLVSTKFSEARASGSLVFSDTQLATLRSSNGVIYQLRYCPALAKKPTDNKPKPEKSEHSTTGTTTTTTTAPKKPKFDPFENPSEALLVAALPGGGDKATTTHNLVLNKFPVIPNHSILATRENKLQLDLLEEDDLGLTYDLVKEWHDSTHDRGSSHSLFAFFNSGEHSGASQPHRHLQFLPVEDMKHNSNNPDSNSNSSEWSVLINTMSTPYQPNLDLNHPLLHNPHLPFVHFAIEIDSTTITPALLHDHYQTLLNAAIRAISSSSSSSSDLSQISSITKPGTNHTPISYNLALTLDRIAICPRSAETATIFTTVDRAESKDDDDDNSVSINGTILAGTLMVKSEKAWEKLKGNPDCLDGILVQIGYRDRDRGGSPLPSTYQSRL